jgi:hypothetical protein
MIAHTIVIYEFELDFLNLFEGIKHVNASVKIGVQIVLNLLSFSLKLPAFVLFAVHVHMTDRI